MTRMRLAQIHARTEPNAIAASQRLARLAAGIGTRRAIWSALHLLGAGIFVLAMITRLAQAAPELVTTGGPTLTPSERPLPFDPHMH
jgi:hypothetical protein